MPGGSVVWDEGRGWRVRISSGAGRKSVGSFAELSDACAELERLLTTGEVLVRGGPVVGPLPVCACGCGGVVSKVGRRWVGSHHKRKSAREYVVDGVSGCWVWQLGVRHDGYGRYKRAGAEAERAHRAYWIRHRGPIPAGFHVHHECGNKLCVNPAHLECLSPVEHGALHQDGVPYGA